MRSWAITANLPREMAAAARTSAEGSTESSSIRGRISVRSSQSHRPRAAHARTWSSGSFKHALNTEAKSRSRLSAASSIILSSISRRRSVEIRGHNDTSSRISALLRLES